MSKSKDSEVSIRPFSLGNTFEENLFWTNCAIIAAESDLKICRLRDDSGSESIYRIEDLIKIVSPFSKNQNGITPLMSAAKAGNRQIFDNMSLFINPSEVSLILSPDNQGKNIIHYAVMSGDVNMVDDAIKLVAIRLCDRRAIWEDIVNEEDLNGETPLDLAVEKKVDLEIIKLLLEYVDDATKNYKVLMKAAVEYKAAADLLIDNGALSDLDIEHQSVLSGEEIINLIVENLDKIIVDEKDNGTTLVGILDCLSDPNIRALLNKSNDLIVSALLDEEIITNHDMNNIKKEEVKIDRIRKFGCELVEALKPIKEETNILPEVIAALVTIDMVREKFDESEDYKDWQSSEYIHPEITDKQKVAINDMIEKHFPKPILSKSNSVSNLSGNDNQKGGFIIS